MARRRADSTLGHPAKALQVLSESPKTGDQESDTTLSVLRAVAHALLGQREEAERILVAATSVAENPTGLSHMHHAQFYIGSTLAILDRHDDAVRWLEKAVEEGYKSYPKFSTDKSLARLKGHKGFAALLERLRKDQDGWQEL